MPYALTFTKRVETPGVDGYINDSCIGGDMALDRLLPALRNKYGDDLQSNQEDWGGSPGSRTGRSNWQWTFQPTMTARRFK
jgi:hypothetical protein